MIRFPHLPFLPSLSSSYFENRSLSLCRAALSPPPCLLRVICKHFPSIASHPSPSPTPPSWKGAAATVSLSLPSLNKSHTRSLFAIGQRAFPSISLCRQTQLLLNTRAHRRAHLLTRAMTRNIVTRVRKQYTYHAHIPSENHSRATSRRNTHIHTHTHTHISKQTQQRVCTDN